MIPRDRRDPAEMRCPFCEDRSRKRGRLHHGGQLMRNPPILISVIGFFAALAGFNHFFFGLRLLGFDWFGLFGDIPSLESAGLWGWLAVITGIIWILVAFGLWAMQG